MFKKKKKKKRTRAPRGIHFPILKCILRPLFPVVFGQLTIITETIKITLYNDWSFEFLKKISQTIEKLKPSLYTRDIFMIYNCPMNFPFFSPKKNKLEQNQRREKDNFRPNENARSKDRDCLRIGFSRRANVNKGRFSTPSNGLVDISCRECSLLVQIAVSNSRRRMEKNVEETE